MTLSAGVDAFYCIRCGLPWPAEHIAHPEDGDDHPPLSRLPELARRQAQLRGEYLLSCPTCRVGPGGWCLDLTGARPGENAPAAHPERPIA